MEIIYKFTEKDFKLLEKDILDSPCVKCGTNVSVCCGCKEESEHRDSIKAYKDLGIYDYARTLTMIRKYDYEISTLNRVREDLIKELPDEIVKRLISK